MKHTNIKILDCTLRDGGRLFDCNFSNKVIKEIINNLIASKIDFIELGFLRNVDIKRHDIDNTFFNNMYEAEKIVDFNDSTEYTLFVDYGLYDVEKLPIIEDGSKIKNLRYGFSKKDYYINFDKIERDIETIIKKGYMVFIQPINILAYSKKELINLLKFANKYSVRGFAIVDTYGSLYSEDLLNLSKFLDKNLNKSIILLFHSHNSYQLSFSLAILLIKTLRKRDLIIDTTLSGIGKCAGNLPTELICNYLNEKYSSNYILKNIYNLNDDFILKYKLNFEWGYNQYSLMQAKYQVHPNNIMYLMKKNINLVKTEQILSKLDDYSKLRYFFDTLDKLIEEVNNNDGSS